MAIYLNRSTSTTRHYAMEVYVHSREATREQFLAHRPGDRDEYGVVVIFRGGIWTVALAIDPAEVPTLASEAHIAQRTYRFMSLAQICKCDPEAGLRLAFVPKSTERQRDLLEQMGFAGDETQRAAL